MRIYRLLIILLFCLLIVQATAQATVLNRIGDPFAIKNGGRALALGRAYTALGDDGSSIFYNPASIVKQNSMSLTLTDPQNISIGQIFSTDIGNIGVGFSLLSKDNIYTSPTTTQNFKRNVLVVSYSSLLSNFIQMEGIGDISLGAALKMYRINFGGSASGNDIDLGIAYKPLPLPYLSLGFAAQNVLPANSSGVLKWDTTGIEESIPSSLNFGIGLNLLGPAASLLTLSDQKLVASLDMDISKLSNTTFTRFGLEYQPLDFLLLRAGYDDQRFVTNGLVGNAGVTTFGLGGRIGDFIASISSSTLFDKDKNTLFFSVDYAPHIEIEDTTSTKEVEKPSINIIKPKEDKITTFASTLIIRGTTNKSAKIKVNENSIFNNEAGSFIAVVPLDIGKNLIVVKARLSDGQRAIAKKRVLRKVKVKIKSKVALTNEELQNVENLASIGVLQIGKGEVLKVDDPVNKGEFLQWLMKAKGYNLGPVKQNVSKDVTKDNPYAPYMKKALEIGLINFDSQGNLAPKKIVTEEEANQILEKFNTVK